MLRKVFSLFMVSLFMLSFLSVSYASDVASETASMQGVVVKKGEAEGVASLAIEGDNGNTVTFSVDEGVSIKGIAIGDAVKVNYAPEEGMIKAISKISS